MMKQRNLLLFVLMISISAVFVRCSKDEGTITDQRGQVAVKVTDAPSDDAKVQGTFITIADVKIDGQSVEGFTKQTIEVSAYQNGETKLLVNQEVAAKSYNSISLVLDNEKDASGNAPGCYVLTEDGKKHNLSSESTTKSEISFNNSFSVESDAEASLVVDFDLRKLIVHRSEGSQDSEYRFVTNAEIVNSVRMVEEDSCGDISGKVNTMFNSENEMYVFAYHKGSFDANAESTGQGDSNVLFANAVTSAKVDANGNYTLSFLEEGDYEIQVASFEKDASGQSSFKAMVNANSTISGVLLNHVSVSAKAQTELNIELTGLL